jgi:hypothetical protein
MQESTRLLAGWDSFYVMVGSSAAALTGLQFVVMALASETLLRASTREIDAFSTPTIVHFGAVLLISAILSAPWGALHGPALMLLVTGVAGVGYTFLVLWRARRAPNYRMVTEDWIFHVLLPLAAYTVLVAAAASMTRTESVSLFIVAADALLLLFVGIHNAWDTATYLALERIQRGKESPPRNTRRH